MATRKARKSASHARRSAAARRGQDALALLREDHERVQALFERYERARSGQKESLAATICRELTVHARIEEEIFYPAVREAIDDDDLMNEARVEHDSVRELVRQIESASPADDLYDAKVEVLGEYVKHHVKEEQGEMFRQARAAGLDLVALGERLKARKQELMAGMPSGERMRGERRSAGASVMTHLSGTA